MKCPSCQDALADDAEFCGTCGMSTAEARINASTQIYLHQQTTSDSRDHHTDEPYPHKRDPRVGLILDSKYKLLEHLGEGGMGAVFRAQRLHIGDEVAVKLLHPDLVREKQALQRFRREARSAAMIRHQNVVSIHDFSDGVGAAQASGGRGPGEPNREAYIVMELVKGVSLGSLLRHEGRMGPRRAVDLMRDICAGVGVAHRQGLLHRDLKPDNVIVTPPSHEGDEETAKVVDFGLAKVRDVAASTALTHTGAVIGTLYYMSPEQCSGEELDARADVYSLGAMFYEMLSGGPPFRSNNLAGLIARHLNEPPPPFPESLEVPPALAAVCFRALAKDRNKRPPDAIAFGRALQMALTAPVEPSSAETRRDEPVHHAAKPGRASSSPSKWLVVAFGVFLAVSLVIGSVFAIKYGMDQLRSNPSDVVNEPANQNSSPVMTPNEPVQPAKEATTAANVDLKGTWSGTYGPFGQPSKLLIKSHKNGELDGVLEQGGIRVAFKGSYDSGSRVVKMKQTAVLQGEGWNLGEDLGKLSPDGRKLTGTGKDALGNLLGMSYEWSFTRK